MPAVKIIECPRDAMQGMNAFVPTKTKIEYINALLKVGFDTLDCGSFVSEKMIPQMADTKLILPHLELEKSDTKLSVIVGNKRGAEEACEFDEITYIGYPFSISETFQKRNTNCDLEESMQRVDEIINLCECYGKTFVCYISMAFGNPYDDFYNAALVEHWVDRLFENGINKFSISDTIGIATPEIITNVFSVLSEDFPEIGFGAHFHTIPSTWQEKVEAAWNAGCTRFDGAMKGFGGCPMAKDELTGNMPTENLLAYFDERKIEHGLNKDAFIDAMVLANRIFV
ncbi:MAG TPA: hydroxymethylglutaryl-CoA lyase [Chitinophagales bacterium]|nr:hydroxymethylglutaryl-CoA lyase [Chitinophagales bacterium]